MAAFFRRPFVRSLTVVFVGTSVAQAISFVSAAWVGRLYTPAEFGVFGAFTSLVGIVGAGVTLQYSQALVLPRRKNTARALLLAALLSVLLISAFSALFAAFFPRTLLTSMQASDEWSLLMLFPLAVACSGTAQVLQSWSIRNKRFHLTSASQMIRSLSVTTGQVALGCAGATHVGLMSSTVLGEALAATAMGGALRQPDPSGRTGWRTSLRRVVAAARRYKDFPVYATPQNVMNALSQGLPVLMLAQSFGIATAGFYALAIRLMQAPMNLVLSPLRDVLFQKASEVHNAGGDLRRLHYVVTAALLAAGLLPALLIFITAPSLFSWFLGERWRVAGEYGRWLVIWLLPMFCNVPSVLVGRILRQQRNLLLFDVLVLVARIAAISLGVRFFSAEGTIALFSVTGAALNVAFIVWVAVLVHAAHPKPSFRPNRAAGGEGVGQDP